MELNLPWREILIGLASISVFYVLQKLVGLLRSRKTEEPGQTEIVMASGAGEPNLTAFRQELDELRQRVVQLETRLQDAPAPAAKPEIAAYPDQPVYATATMLARDGLSAEELSQRCGISFSEAELIVALNRQKGAAGQNARQLS